MKLTEKELDTLMWVAFKRGFMAAGEGWNGDCGVYPEELAHPKVIKDESETGELLRVEFDEWRKEAADG